ncbi:MAG: hypothetical protein A2015_09235 [Spirochaetes bacterium GWF1_31_7]|nr:MAG: hypothetical protein A2Y30_08985 [Spirochaetes bacterium GWE1_32_154]OHD47671.1 MAG: hypothetical protein A2015_09235 [Spirochaetes bacterium GWF1_31_7]HBD94773.1 hypothetical protein [Spirochaetia bacterium]
MASLEKYTLRELEGLIREGKKFRLFKPFMYNGQMLLNIEKVLTESDIMRLDKKVFGPIEVVPAVEHNTNSQIRNAIAENFLKILKTTPLFSGEKHHLDFTVRKECEKIIDGVIKGNAHLAQKLLEIYQSSKKLFIHSVNVSLISIVIEIGLQTKRKIHNALALEELFTASALHDIGMLSLPKEMLEKKRHEYTDDEKSHYRFYPQKSRDVLESMGDAIRKKSLEIVIQHQERLPGTGFPKGLKGKEIDEMALIIGLADDFDLMISKEAFDHTKEIAEIMSRFSRSGNIYSSDVIDSFYTWFRYLK